MENLFDFLTQSAFQEIHQHNQTANTRHVPKAHSTHGKVRDISSRDIRQRLIHLLALQPFTQRELNECLQKDGIRKPEESLIGNVLAEIAQLSNNEFFLKSCMWNEVETNWPYYTEQERQQLKLWKTQNMSIPASANRVTSTSNQTSPTIPTIISASLPILKEAVIEICGKRPCLEYEEPQIKKKRRISHVSVGSSNNTHSQLNIQNISNKSPYNGAQAGHKQILHNEPIHQIASRNNNAEKSRQQKPTLQKNHKVSGDRTHKKSSQEEPITKPASELAVFDNYKNNQCQESVSEIASKFLGVDNNKQQRNPVLQTHSVVPGSNIYKSRQHQRTAGISAKGKNPKSALQINNEVSSKGSQKKSLEPVINTASEVTVIDTHRNNKRQESVPQVASKVSVTDSSKNDKHQKQVLQTNSAVSGSDAYRSHQRHEPVHQKTTTEHSVIENTLIPSYDFSFYSTIQSIKQRREYKCDFERVYEEYFRLRQRVEEVRYIFRVLPEQLKNVPEGSSEYQHIANRIFAEFERLNSKEEIELKQRFDYLEAKLIHIKQLVDDFDQNLTKQTALQAALAAYLQT